MTSSRLDAGLQIIPEVTGHATVDTAIAAIRLEASDYLIKPIGLDGAPVTSVGHALKRADSPRGVERAKPESTDAAALREFADVATELAGNLRLMSRPGPMRPSRTPRRTSRPSSCFAACRVTADDFRRRSDARAGVGNDR